MVASTAKGQIDLSTLTVSGEGQAGRQGRLAPGAVIAAPAVAGQLNVVPPATENEPLAQRKAADAEPARQRPAAQPAVRPSPAHGAQPTGRRRPWNSTAARFRPRHRRRRDSKAD